MPMVGKKKYPYTKKGKMAAKKAAKKKGMKVKKIRTTNYLLIKVKRNPLDMFHLFKNCFVGLISRIVTSF